MEIIQHDSKDEYSHTINLPISQSEMSSFILGVLGERQTIKKKYTGSFQVEMGHIINIHYLITQRVHEQNNGEVFNFKTTIYYDDNSSLPLSSLEQLKSYNETRDLDVCSIHVKWRVLTFFDDDKPEYQEINIIFDTAVSEEQNDSSVIAKDNKEVQTGLVYISIDYTKRSWGVDIENLLSNSINLIVEKRNVFFKVTEKITDSRLLQPILMIALISIMMFTIFSVGDQKFQEYQKEINSYLSENMPRTIKEKNNFVFETILMDSFIFKTINTDNRFSYKDNLKLFELKKKTPKLRWVLLFSLALAVTVIIISFLIINWLKEILHVSSHILFTERSKINMKKRRNMRSLKITMIVIGFFLNIAIGVSGNYIYNLL